MMSDNYIHQVGQNDAYPDKILVWRYGTTVPEWLSDRAKVKFIDASGQVTLDIRETSTAGIEIIDTSGQGSLVILGSKADILCYSESSGRIFSLRPKQFKLLYGEI